MTESGEVTGGRFIDADEVLIAVLETGVPQVLTERVDGEAAYVCLDDDGNLVEWGVTPDAR